MCGLAGMLLASPCLHGEQIEAMLRPMSAAVSHRGPDDAGAWCDAQAGVGLAHRRLSIQDLSALGHQPMASADGRYVIVFNGEIYNFMQLRAALVALGHRFRSHCDTEVLLAAVMEWGLEDTLARCNGMFAFAMWDQCEHALWLARDRVGKKPLYYGWAGQTLVFGSELKVLWQHPDFDNGIDRDALTLLLRLGYIPAPACIHERAFKLMPGRVLRLDAMRVAAGPAAHRPDQAQRPFWNACETMHRALAAPFCGSQAQAEEQLDGLLRDAVGLRMVADVPVGVFLSGGTDSSIVTAMMQTLGRYPVRSFSIGFEESNHDEAPLAREVAAHLRTDHTELYVSGSDAFGVVPQLPEMFDEPFADASQVPTALVARLARRAVTVALSGDGGDELFFGYGRYQRALRNWRLHGMLPKPLRQIMAWAGRDGGEASRTSGLAALLAEAGAQGIGDIYRHRVSRWRDPAAAVLGAREPDSFYSLADPLRGCGTPADAMMLADFVAYLPDDLLCKIDRTTMAVGLEARAPLLDWRVAAFAWTLPLPLKYRDGVSKYLLKRVLCRYLPEPMVYRAKRGFGAPVSTWLRHDLNGWAGDLLAHDKLQREGIFAADTVTGIWRAFNRGQRKWHTHVWTVLMFQAWQQHWRAQRAVRSTRV